MTDRAQNEMTCSQFEALLAEALDEGNTPAGAAVQSGTELAALPLQLRQSFVAHREACPDCGPLYAEVREGMLLLRSLEEVDPPRNLVHNILAVTSGAEDTRQAAIAGAQPRTGWLERMRTRLAPSFAALLRSRFAASFCMAFFSLSLTLSLTGVKFSEIAHMASHPNELRKSVVLEYTQLEARVMRYYDNMRLVYEVQNRVRELRKAAAPVQTPNNGTSQPDQQNLIQPAPGVPSFQEVAQPQVQDAYQREWDGRETRELTQWNRASRLSDTRKLTAYEFAEFMRKTEGAQI